MAAYLVDLCEIADHRGRRLQDTHETHEKAKEKPIENATLHITEVQQDEVSKTPIKPESPPKSIEPPSTPKKKRKVPLKEIQVMSRAQYIKDILKEFDHE